LDLINRKHNYGEYVNNLINSHSESVSSVISNDSSYAGDDKSDDNSTVGSLNDVALEEDREIGEQNFESENDESDYEDIDNVINEDSDSDSSENVADNTSVPICYSASDLVNFSNAKREVRFDARSFELIDAFWHSSTQYNTNTNKEKIIFNSSTGKWESHRERLQTVPAVEIFKSFLNTIEYQAQLTKTTSTSLTLFLFLEGKCRCIKWDRLRKCADCIKAQFKEYMLALKRIYRKMELKFFKECQCPN
jgi:hypothetical protein